MNFGIVKTLLLGIVALGALAIMGIDIAMLAGAEGLAAKGSASIAIAAVSLCAAVIIALGALLIIFNSAYTFKSDKLLAVLGVFVDRISYDDILCFKQNSLNGELYLITRGVRPTDGEIGFKLNLSPQMTDGFIAKMREHVPDIIVDVFTPERKDKDKK